MTHHGIPDDEDLGPVENAVVNLIKAITATDDEAATLTRQVLEGEAYIIVNQDGVAAHADKGGEATNQPS